MLFRLPRTAINGRWNLLEIGSPFSHYSNDWLRMSIIRNIEYTPFAIYKFTTIDNTLSLEILHRSCESNDLS